MEDNGSVVGFCKIDICGYVGKLDYLVVLKEYRGKGYGKVVDGNEAIHLYEKYGFKMNAHILVNNR